MNLLMRSNTRSAAPVPQPVKGPQVAEAYLPRDANNNLEDLITDDPFLDKVTFEAQNVEIDKYQNENSSSVHSSEARFSRFDSHIDIKEDAGSIIIPSDKVLDNWTEAPDMHSLCSLDRSFIFPGEQIQIFAWLSAYKHDTEIITPFKVAAVMNKNGICKSPEKHNGSLVEENNPIYQSTSSDGCGGQQDEILMKESTNISTGESLLRMESRKKQTEELLRSLENSYYFVRVAGSNEPLWSKRGSQVAHARNSVDGEQLSKNSLSSGERIAYASVMSDRGKVDTNSSGGLARGAVKCCSLPNGDLVVLLQVNFGVQFISDPILEILQFEKHQPLEETLESRDSMHFKQDPYGQLLKWLLPLDNSILPLDRPISSPLLTPSSSIRSTSGRSTASGSASSQVFSFGHSRSHSMSSLPANTSTLNAVTTPNGKKRSNLEDRNQSLPEKFVRSGRSEIEDLLSFRGVPLQPERFLVQCGLEGILRPGRRWRRKIELIQPLKIDSFSVECNTEDLICVVVKNVSPAEGPDIVVYIDAITLVLEDASKGGRPLSLPVSCIEPGNGCSLPNLALRRGEEHSFILKPVATSLKQPKILNNSRKQPRHPSSETAASPWYSFPNAEGKESGPPTDQYAVIVSCRCNYTDSMLVFKQPTNWQPCVSRDLMISVASEMSEQASESDRASLPSQVLTLQASNKTSENLTLTVLAPASLTSPSVVPLNNSPCSPSAEAAERVRTDGKRPVVPKSSRLSMGQGVVEADKQTTMAPNGDLGCTHLWLKSRVPLGCVPPQSTATIKLEVLPLTDGIITLDSLQIEVKEKGITYVPEQSLKIHATSSIATGIL